MDPTLETLAASAFDNVYHVGHVVPDLLSAMDSLAGAMQITWAPPFEMRSGFTRPDGSADDQPVRLAFSTSGPPYLELIEVVAAPDSIFAEPRLGGMHHMGYYAQSWRDDTARLQDDGWELERTGSGVAFLRDPRSGLRVEVVSAKGRDFLSRVLSGEMAEAYPLTVRP
ncbi:VOC family protein [Mycobacterium sp. ITM-2016-00317]|uniref:VOC family protein n=1 Tax=Mycobacterium sp. ITM-2016-00317 TaxID=2099694 RepID=UPI00287F7646|nr:VOC family protein [Mycobacterium sp. ITM-2016-00317]WNG89295.1 VOC family protein [Mycobacterium sp. ITM-2016-00317]